MHIGHRTSAHVYIAHRTSAHVCIAHRTSAHVYIAHRTSAHFCIELNSSTHDRNVFRALSNFTVSQFIDQMYSKVELKLKDNLKIKYRK